LFSGAKLFQDPEVFEVFRPIRGPFHLDELIEAGEEGRNAFDRAVTSYPKSRSASCTRLAFSFVGSMKMSMSSVARAYPWMGNAVAPMTTKRALCSFNDRSSFGMSMGI